MKRIRDKISQADRIRKLEDQVESLATITHDISSDLDELRIIIRKLLKALKDD